MMKLYARTKRRSYLNDYRGESWQAVTVKHIRYPSGEYECVRFIDGYECKAIHCDVCYVFDKEEEEKDNR
jgi:hypothetical protein